MATYGVIADIHGNLEALRAVLTRLDREGVDQVVCLGDLVGYNADSNQCVDLIASRGINCIAGNHDLIALGYLGFDRCAVRPEFALRRTRRALTARTRRFLQKLPPMRIYDDQIALIHGGVDDVCAYMRTPQNIADNAARLAAWLPAVRLCWFGHTHAPGIFTLRRDGVQVLRGPGHTRLDRDQLTFVNPGSVDAARRPEKLAQFAVFDADDWSVTLGQVAYDHESAERKSELSGYRMNRLDEALYGARRFLQSASNRATRRVLGA